MYFGGWDYAPTLQSAGEPGHCPVDQWTDWKTFGHRLTLGNTVSLKLLHCWKSYAVHQLVSLGRLDGKTFGYRRTLGDSESV